jgi:Domain of unknown function (DUF1707)
MRVSDADRAEIADCLAKHYSHGRLDQAEFEQRLDMAMRATTVADLSALLADLPGDQPGGLPASPPASPPGSLPGSLPGERRSQRRLQQLQVDGERILLNSERRELHRQRRPARAGPLRWIALFAVVLFLAVLAAHAITQLVFASLVVGVIVLLVMLFGRPGRRHGPGGGQPRPGG